MRRRKRGAGRRKRKAGLGKEKPQAEARKKVTAPDFSVFVSYETKGGLAYARLLKARLRSAELGAWVWHDDKTIGEIRDEEIANKIFELPHFVYICTDNSHESSGQKDERGLARTLGRVPVVVELEGAFVSPLLKARVRIPTTPALFERACDEVAEEIQRREQIRVGDAHVEKEGQPLEPA